MNTSYTATGTRFTTARIAPMATVLLNNPAALESQIANLEDSAAFETSLSESGARDRLWRLATALRVVEKPARDNPAALSLYCQSVDLARAKR